ncbi:MAG: hypothetical protein AAGH41_12130 [Pseudomonadota bacterium]
MPAVYEPYRPQNELQAIVPGIWTAEGPAVGYQTAGVNLPCPTRMTVLDMGGGNLLLHSPIAFDAALANAIAETGKVAAIAAPNSFHYLGVTPWAEHFADAAVYAPAKRPKAAKLPERTIALIDGRLSTNVEIVIADGGAWMEAAFFHRPSKTLVLTDLVQNFETSRVNSWLARVMLRIGGAASNPPKASIDMRLGPILGGQTKQLRQSFDEIIALGADRVLIAHGPHPEGDVTTLLKHSFSWA